MLKFYNSIIHSKFTPFSSIKKGISQLPAICQRHRAGLLLGRVLEELTVERLLVYKSIHHNYISWV